MFEGPATLENTRPPCLVPGSTVGVFAPSFPTAGMFPDRLQFALEALQREFQLQAVVAPHVHGSGMGFQSDAPEARAAVFNEFLADDDIQAIFCTIGGFNSAEMLPYIDTSLAREKPKILVGYSDCTALLLGLHSVANWVTFHGPAVMTQFGEFPKVLPETLNSLRQAICGGLAGTELMDPRSWTNERLEWGTNAWRERSRHMLGRGERKIWRAGDSQGQLWGGNIETLNMLIGTPYVRPPEDIVLFWEATEEEAYLPRIRRALVHLDQCGVLARVRAMLIGRIPEARDVLGADLKSTVLDCLSHYEFPIIADLAIGHTDPLLTLPIGTDVEVCASAMHSAIRFGTEAVITQIEAGIGKDRDKHGH